MKNQMALLSQKITKEANLLIATASQVPVELRTKKAIAGTGGQISVSDLIAYTIGWGNLLLGWYNSGITGTMPSMPGEGFTKWDYIGLAQHFYTKYKYDNGDEQLKQFELLVQHIIAMVEKEYKTGNLEKLNVWPWCTLPSGKQWTLDKWVRVNTIAPYKRATTLIKHYLKQNN